MQKELLTVEFRYRDKPRTVDWRNGGTSFYNLKSEKELDSEEILQYLKDFHDFDEDDDSFTLIGDREELIYEELDN